MSLVPLSTRQHNTASQPRRPRPETSPLWKPQNSLLYFDLILVSFCTDQIGVPHWKPVKSDQHLQGLTLFCVPGVAFKLKLDFWITDNSETADSGKKLTVAYFKDYCGVPVRDRRLWNTCRDWLRSLVRELVTVIRNFLQVTAENNKVLSYLCQN
jgi:hypothetical protein